MTRLVRYLTTAVAAVALFTIAGAAGAQPKDKGAGPDAQAQKGGGQHKAKHHNHDGKSLLGEKVKKEGKHEFHKNGKFTASAEVRGGKIAGVSVKHADKGDVPVKKYRTNKKMSELSRSDLQPAPIILAQYLGTTYIGFAYIDDYGDEVIYWFPYDMVLDPDTGAVEYLPA